MYLECYFNAVPFLTTLIHPDVGKNSQNCVVCFRHVQKTIGFAWIGFYHGGLWQRVTVAQIRKTDWFKKGYTPAKFEQKDDINLDDIESAFSESTVSHTINQQMCTFSLQYISRILLHLCWVPCRMHLSAILPLTFVVLNPNMLNPKP